MKKFENVLEKYRQEVEPKEVKLSEFYKSIAKKNPINIYLTEQDAPPEEAPSIDPGGPPPMQMNSPGGLGPADEPEEPAEVELENIPYALMAWYAFKALLINPSEITSSEYYDQLQDLTGGGDKAKIDSPEKGVRIFQVIEKIIDDKETPSNSDIPQTAE